MPRHKGGRPSKFTPELREKLLQAIRIGVTYKLACQAVGLAYSTFNQWMRLGESDNPPHDFKQFAEDVKRSEGEGLAHAIGVIRKAASEGTWQAAAWLAERRYPVDYGRTVNDVKFEGKVVNEQRVAIQILADPEARKLALALERRLTARPSDASGSGEVHKPGRVEALPAPAPANGKTHASGGGGDPKAGGDDAAGPREELPH